jgi:hypothetical protein
MDMRTLTLHVFSDAAFANNDDFVCKLGYLAFLSDQEGNCALLDYKSMKARRVTRSILAGELIAFAEAFDRSFVLKSDLEDMLNAQCEIPIRMYTDSQSLFDVISKRSMTAERRLQIDIALAREGFDRKWISDIALVASLDNLADALTKPWASGGFLEVLKSTRLRTHARRWIVRWILHTQVAGFFQSSTVPEISARNEKTACTERATLIVDRAAQIVS